MPAQGKHRRPKAQRITGVAAAVGTGGAAIALPLLGATGAHAAAPQSAQAPAAQKTVAAASATAPKTYSVVKGDCLYSIAVQQHVSGGWKKLYSDNRDVVGGNPAKILPGMKLTVGKAAAPAPSSSAGTGKSDSAQSARKSTASGTAEQPASSSATSTTGFVKPVDASIGTSYRASGSSWSSGYHTGVDFLASSGSVVKSVGAGTVVSAGWGGSYGNQVVIKHTDGYYSQYAHLSSITVSAGQSVGAGEQIGLSGATGNASGPHLHFEIRTGPDYGSDVDPLAYLRQHGVGI